MKRRIAALLAAAMLAAAAPTLAETMRIGDQAVNLSEWVEFSVTGVHKHDGVEYE